MVGSKELVDFRHCLFQLVLDKRDDPHRLEKECNCTHTEKRVRCVCRMDELQGISLVPVVYKAMCGVIQKRLTQVFGERNLVVEEQGGFRRGRGCREQLLTLMLLEQIKAMSKDECLLGSLILGKHKIEWAGRNCGAVWKV